MSFFTKFFKQTQSSEQDIKFINHFQEILAFQQLFMERYNDALSVASGVQPANEAFSRPSASLNDTEAIEKYIIPALEEKIAILREMQLKHEQIGEPSSDELKDIYDSFTNALALMERRAHLQHDGFSLFVKGEDNVDVTKLDAEELRSMDIALLKLNTAIQSFGLTADDFLKINCNAFNNVRASIGLPALSQESFQKIYFAGISGEPARFFTIY